LPEFWFPEGWNYSFEMPEGGTRAFWVTHLEPAQEGGFSIRFDMPLADSDSSEQSTSLTESTSDLRSNQKAKLTAQRFATAQWEVQPELTIAEIIRSEPFCQLPDVAHYGSSAHRKWVSQVAPIHIKGKKGRPKTK
jgi:hypothetical protein